MRRIYHRFPLKIDLDFDLERPFREVLTCIGMMNGTHITTRRNDKLVKSSVAIEISDNMTGFTGLDALRSLADEVTDAADFRIEIHETLLKGEGRFPLSADTFLLRIQDQRERTGCIVVKEGSYGAVDAMDLKRMLLGACK